MLESGDFIDRADGSQFQISYFDQPNTPGAFKLSGGSSVSLLLTAVPEPGSGHLLLAGLGSLAGLRRFRRRA